MNPYYQIAKSASDASIHHQRSVKYEYVAQVLAALRRAGLTKLGFELT